MITKWANALEKQFLHKELIEANFNSATALQGEVFSLQLLYKPDFPLAPLDIEVVSPLKEFIRVRQVVSTPATFFGENQDDFILDKTPGLYPDLLNNYSTYRSSHESVHSLWVTVSIPKDFASGTYPISLILTHKNAYRPERNFSLETPQFNLNILPVQLPEAKLKVAMWLHCDCLADTYNLEPWSDEFFKVLKNYLLNMVSHGINMVYVPLFTPPLDTHIGLTRPTMQSVNVKVDDNENYSFCFDNLEKFISLALSCGIKHLEFSHLFTQWGAKFTPKIMVETSNGALVQKFGWHVESKSSNYQNFLAQFLPQLYNCLIKNNWEKLAYFHISDEPYEDNLEDYKRASTLFHKTLPNCKFFDALSRPEYVEKSLVEIPVVANNHLDEFLKFNLKERWTYYCVSQWNKVPNQFTHLPSIRNRILGVLAYVYNLDGFLHWGYNFWFGQLSMFKIDPFNDTCAGGGFPPGDAFKVYPGKDGTPLDSIRHEVFFDGLQDLACLELLENKIGRKNVLNLIKESFYNQEMTMVNYPKDNQWLLDFRNKVNMLLAD